MATNKNSRLGKKNTQKGPSKNKSNTHGSLNYTAEPLIPYTKGDTNPQSKAKTNAARSAGARAGATNSNEAWEAYNAEQKRSASAMEKRDAQAAYKRSNAPAVAIKGASADPRMMASGLRSYNPQAMPWSGGVMGSGGRQLPTEAERNPGQGYGWGGRDNSTPPGFEEPGERPLSEFSDETDGPPTFFNQSDRQLEENRRNQTPFQEWMNSGQNGPMPIGDTNIREQDRPAAQAMDPSLTKFDTDGDGKVSFEEQRAANGVSPGSFASGGTFKADNPEQAKQMSNDWNAKQQQAREMIGQNMPGMDNMSQQLPEGVQRFGGQQGQPGWLDKARSSSMGRGGGGYRPSPERPPNMWAGGTPDFDESAGGEALLGGNPMFGKAPVGMSPGQGQQPSMGGGRPPGGMQPPPGPSQQPPRGPLPGAQPNMPYGKGPQEMQPQQQPQQQGQMADTLRNGAMGQRPRPMQRPQQQQPMQPQQQPMQQPAAARSNSLSSALRGG